jgi:hypothetical protein
MYMARPLQYLPFLTRGPPPSLPRPPIHSPSSHDDPMHSLRCNNLTSRELVSAEFGVALASHSSLHTLDLRENDLHLSSGDNVGSLGLLLGRLPCLQRLGIAGNWNASDRRRCVWGVMLCVCCPVLFVCVLTSQLSTCAWYPCFLCWLTRVTVYVHRCVCTSVSCARVIEKRSSTCGGARMRIRYTSPSEDVCKNVDA